MCARILPCRDEFDEEAYLQLNPDVAAAIEAKIVDSGWQHFTLHGVREKRSWKSRPNRMAGVSSAISVNDGMFLGNRDHYFDVGEKALHCIERALREGRRLPDTIKRILDLPCGHGRVLRFIKKAFPHAHLTACDLNADGVAFCAEAFGAEPIVSLKDAAAIPLPAGFDLIWCGSLLTHLSSDQGVAFLRLFQRALAPGGILVFTLHGRSYEETLVSGTEPTGLTKELEASLLSQYRESGFGYVDYPGQPGYGYSLAHPSYVVSRLLNPGWRFLSHHEQGWNKRQDVVALQWQS
ncbi:MAG: class I SAM-dependent methyltransferase [Opitutae bacterium]|nr:class I SAM-dependent methyltransferase [Opitutae bacterium]